MSLQWCTCGHAPSVRLARLDKLAAHVEPAPPALTPSEVALAKVLAAWDQWPGRGAGDDGPTLVMCAVHEVLFEHRLISPGAITSDGESLLDRARKAGVL